MKKLILLVVLLMVYANVSAQAPREVVYEYTNLGNGKYQFEILQKPALGLSTNPRKSLILSIIGNLVMASTSSLQMKLPHILIRKEARKTSF